MMIEGESTDLNSTSTHNNGRVIIDHNHPLHLLPNNTPDFSTDKVKGIGKKDQGLYILQNKFVVQNSSLSPVKHAHFVEQVSDSSFLWHRILGHAPSEVIRKHTSLSNLKYIKHLCTVCPLAKHTK
ncbi:hypothetical protein AABB24_028846 [Solanum stoloniferum]|uniref:GAG-pre-integrase domain-containing protein n=1 Tax=Solanum stoloniferum TaxID=62892 RepID=A0ABD2S869_9SOLN